MFNKDQTAFDASERAAQRVAGQAMSRREEVRKASPKPAKTARNDGSKPSGHESFLKALEQSGGGIWFRYLDEPEVTFKGKVRHSDKFTISIEVDGETRVVFKHALRDFGPTERGPGAERKAH